MFGNLLYGVILELWLSGDKVILNYRVSQLKSLLSILWSENIHNAIERMMHYCICFKIYLQWYLVYYFKILIHFNIIIIIIFFNFSFANLVTFCIRLRIWKCQFSEQDQHIITRMHDISEMKVTRTHAIYLTTCKDFMYTYKNDV